MKIEIEKKLRQAIELESKNYFYSSLVFWKDISNESPNPFHKFRYADTLRLCGYYNDAELVFREVNYDAIPNDYKYTLHMYLGSLYSDWGKFSIAKKEFYKAISLNPESTVPYLLLSAILFSDSEVYDAIELLKVATTKEGDVDEVYYNLATRFCIVKDFSNAYNSIVKCLEIDADYPNAFDLKNDLEIYLSVKLN